MSRFDNSFKRMIFGNGSLFAEIFLGLRGTSEMIDMDTELPAILHREADCIFKHTDPEGVVRYLHYEFQSDFDPEMPKRMLLYYALIWNKFNQPPLQLLIHLGEHKKDYINLIEHSHLNFRYDICYLQEQPLELFTDRNHPSEILLGVLGQYPHPEEKIRLVVARLRNLELRPNELADYLAIGEVISELASLKEIFIQTKALMALNIDISKSSYFQQGMDMGIEKGIEKGMEAGKTQALMDSALRLYQRGYTPAEIQEILALDDRIMNLFIEKLKRLEGI